MGAVNKFSHSLPVSSSSFQPPIARHQNAQCVSHLHFGFNLSTCLGCTFNLVLGKDTNPKRWPTSSELQRMASRCRHGSCSTQSRAPVRYFSCMPTQHLRRVARRLFATSRRVSNKFWEQKVLLGSDVLRRYLILQAGSPGGWRHQGTSACQEALQGRPRLCRLCFDVRALARSSRQPHTQRYTG